MNRLPAYLLLLLIGYSGLAQHRLTGLVVDENNQPMLGAHIHSNFENTLTNADGEFTIAPLPKGEVRLYVSYIGYTSKDTLVEIHQNTQIRLQLLPETDWLEEVVIQHQGRNGNPNKERVDETFIKENFSGSLAKTLERLPGVNAMEIGAGASKPIIRGLGFNRVVVSENGIKHEGQQWGADHGLEMDALAAEEVEVIKNSGAIEYGSDAIGGVINIRNDNIPRKNSFEGSYTAMGRSVNNTIANSLQLKSRKDKFFYKLTATVSDYGDYNVPTDNIVYLTVNMPVYNNRLKNTAGRERNFLGQIGYVTDDFQSIFTASNTYLKAGFFPGAHGVPSINRVQDDGDSRNIEFPFQRANHFKATSTNKWFFANTDLIVSVNYQNNHRQEFSEFHTHFGNQAPPSQNPDLELDFNLHTLDAQAKVQHYFSVDQKMTFGLQAQLQENTIAGYGFLLPEYDRNSFGAFATYDYKLSEKLAVNAGVRADYATLNTKRFYDPILFEYLVNRGYDEVTAAGFAECSSENNRTFSNFNFLLGVDYEPNRNWDFYATFGTNFRLPTAIELAANGIHHGSFRHEQGNPNLDPERGFVIDGKASYQNKEFITAFSPFVYHFTNYIFLQPSGTFSPLPHGGQIYNFTQSEALLTGFEYSVQNTFFERWNALFVFEYLYNQQITSQTSRNFPLPFSPPANGFFELEYHLKNFGKTIQNTEIAVNTRFALRQDRIAQNEQITDGYTLFGLGLKTNVVFSNFRADVQLQATNLFDVKYFNHTNFYRALEIPEMGRNIQLMIKIPFGGAHG